MYRVAVNGQNFEVTEGKEGWLVDGKPLAWEISALGEGHYHLLHNHTGYNAELIGIDKQSKKVDLKINGKRMSVQVFDKFDLLLEKMGMNASAGSKLNIIKAPMPGLIIDLRVKAGDTVKPGDPLLVLEAMKMENIIKAAGEGTVRIVKIKKGDSVEKNQVLIEF